MSHPWLCRVTFIVLIFILTESNVRTLYTHDTTTDDKAENLSPDFVNFVKDLDLLVFKREQKKNNTIEVKTGKTTNKNTTRRLRNRRRNNVNNIKATQSAALRDILMLKLVSYYEDKYNVAQKEFTTPQMLMPLRRNISPENFQMSNNTDSIEQSTISHDTNMYFDTWVPGAYRSSEKVQADNILEQSTQESKYNFDEVVAL